MGALLYVRRGHGRHRAWAAVEAVPRPVRGVSEAGAHRVPAVVVGSEGPGGAGPAEFLHAPVDHSGLYRRFHGSDQPHR